MNKTRATQTNVQGSPLGPYVTAQIPGWIIAAFAAWWAIGTLEFRVWVVLLFLAGWVAKDIALFPVLGRFYRSEHPAKRMIGAAGVAVTTLEPEGLVRVGGELWQAQSTAVETSISEGTTVRVCDISGLLLFVEAHEARATSSVVSL